MVAAASKVGEDVLHTDAWAMFGISFQEKLLGNCCQIVVGFSAVFLPLLAQQQHHYQQQQHLHAH